LRQERAKSRGGGPEKFKVPIVAARAAQSDGVVKNFADGRNKPKISLVAWFRGRA